MQIYAMDTVLIGQRACLVTTSENESISVTLVSNKEYNGIHIYRNNETPETWSGKKFVLTPACML